MLEADVILGTYNATNATDTKIPIMGHPPENESDLTLDEFLEITLANGKCGIKLDFKSIEAFNASREALLKHKSNVSYNNI